jgi:hypothetical protein
MSGPAALLAAMIFACNPSLPQKTASNYAAMASKAAAQASVDPKIVVALVCTESGWRSGAVSRDGEDWGLGQIRARYLPGCRGDADPTSAPSKTCRATQASLLGPEHNLQIVAKAIKSWRVRCRQQTGHARERNWLAGYVGLGQRGQSKCGMTRRKGRWKYLPTSATVQRVLDTRKRLIRQAAKPVRRKKSR